MLFPQPHTPSQLLAMAIRKRRKVVQSKDPELRVGTLLGATIKMLCRHIGQERASVRSTASGSGAPSTTAKRPASEPPSPVLPVRKRKRCDSDSSHAHHSISASSSDDLARQPFEPMDCNASGPQVDQKTPPATSCQLDEKCSAYDENDPFGLDSFFARLRPSSACA